MKKIIYFLCTGNSCRSQMAEGWAKKYLGDKWEVYSAGIEAHGLNPNAAKVMKEVGIDISNQTSDVINPEILNKADLV
ncbi:MAG: arsenate reductase, partial [Anoxybacillus mongoliensis]|nr:arsenate reductase [Anoxybacillus mongoliensis]